MVDVACDGPKLKTAGLLAVVSMGGLENVAGTFAGCGWNWKWGGGGGGCAAAVEDTLPTLLVLAVVAVVVVVVTLLVLEETSAADRPNMKGGGGCGCVTIAGPNLIPASAPLGNVVGTVAGVDATTAAAAAAAVILLELIIPLGKVCNFCCCCCWLFNSVVVLLTVPLCGLTAAAIVGVGGVVATVAAAGGGGGMPKVKPALGLCGVATETIEDDELLLVVEGIPKVKPTRLFDVDDDVVVTVAVVVVGVIPKLYLVTRLPRAKFPLPVLTAATLTPGCNVSQQTHF